MAGNWGKKTGNFASRSASSGRFMMPSTPTSKPHVTPPKSPPAISGGMLDRVSEALRHANAKNGFVRTDAKK